MKLSSVAREGTCEIYKDFVLLAFSPLWSIYNVGWGGHFLKNQELFHPKKGDIDFFNKFAYV